MAKAKVNEHGELVNSETGEVIGTKSGNRISINSDSSEMLTLEDYGVGIPDFPDDKESTRKNDDEDFSLQSNATEKRQSNNNANVTSKDENVNCPEEKKMHMDVGPTSFARKRTKYEITDSSYFIIRFGLLQKDDGRFIPIKEDAIDEIAEAEPHWVKFRMWNYGEELAWKSEFMEYSNAMKSQYLNIEKLNERKIRRLLLDWSFGEYDDRLKLLHCDGMLSDESYSVFMGLYPSIAGTIVDMMNLVLESNQ